MKKTSSYHGYRIRIITADEAYFWNNDKVYRSLKRAKNIVGKITCGIDEGKIEIPGFYYCQIVEYFDS